MKISKTTSIMLDIALIIQFYLVAFLKDTYIIFLPVLVAFFEVSPQTIKLTFSIYFWGSLLGRFLSIYLLKYMQIYQYILFMVFFFLIGTILCIVYNDITLLFIGRFIQGVTITGMLTTLNAILVAHHEELITHKNVKLSAFTIWSTPISFFVGSYILANYSWKYGFYLMLIITFILFVIVCIFLKSTLSYKLHHISIKSFLIVIKDIHLIRLFLSFGLLSAVIPLYFMEISFYFHIVNISLYARSLFFIIFSIFLQFGKTICSLLLLRQVWDSSILSLGFFISVVSLFINTIYYAISPHFNLYYTLSSFFLLAIGCGISLPLYPRLIVIIGRDKTTEVKFSLLTTVGCMCLALVMFMSSYIKPYPLYSSITLLCLLCISWILLLKLKYDR